MAMAKRRYIPGDQITKLGLSGIVLEVKPSWGEDLVVWEDQNGQQRISYADDLTLLRGAAQ